MCWTLDLIDSSCSPHNQNVCSAFFFFTPTSMLSLTKVVFSFCFFLSPFPFPKALRRFPFLLSCRWSTLLGLRYRWDAATSVTGQGHYCCCTFPSRLRLLLRRRRHATLPSTFPLPLVILSVASPLIHVLLPIVSCVQHLPFPLCCLSVSIHVYSLFYLAL